MGMDVLFKSEIPVYGIMEKLQHSYPDHHDDVVEMIGLYINWIMQQLSDGQRICVQNMIGIIRPFNLLLLDKKKIRLENVEDKIC